MRYILEETRYRTAPDAHGEAGTVKQVLGQIFIDSPGRFLQGRMEDVGLVQRASQSPFRNSLNQAGF